MRRAPLPDRPDAVLFGVLETLQLAGKCIIYFQAAWVLADSILPPPTTAGPADVTMRSLLSCYHSGLLCVLEVVALTTLYVVLANHLCRVSAWCRTAAPLYATPIEAAFPGATPPMAGWPLYCGRQGHGVEGSHAPTRVCDWEDVAGPGIIELRWRERFALRHRAETLAAREARLLSFLDALNVRISETELGIAGSQNRPSAFARVAFAVVAAVSIAILVLFGGFPSGAARTSLPLAMLHSRAEGYFEKLFLAALLIRVAHSLILVLARLCAAGVAKAQLADAEVVALRQQARALHNGLTETQMALALLEVQLANLGIPVQRSNPSQGRRTFSPLWPLLLCWACSVVTVGVRALGGYWADEHGVALAAPRAADDLM
jgi:hypothetical protein